MKTYIVILIYHRHKHIDLLDLYLIAGVSSVLRLTLQGQIRGDKTARNVKMAVVSFRSWLVLRKRLEILKCIQTVPVIYSRCSSDISRHSWEPVEKETHTGQV
jgi:hypothetical protein